MKLLKLLEKTDKEIGEYIKSKFSEKKVFSGEIMYSWEISQRLKEILDLRDFFYGRGRKLVKGNGLFSAVEVSYADDLGNGKYLLDFTFLSLSSYSVSFLSQNVLRFQYYSFGMIVSPEYQIPGDILRPTGSVREALKMIQNANNN